QLLEAMKTAAERAPAETQLALIKAHPDLANKTQRAAGLTAESTAEQDSVGLDRLSDAEYEAFERVNNAYRSKFGFPYIGCVRRVVTLSVTNSEGRTDQPLIGGRPLPIGRYELIFSVGKYFAARGVPTSDPPFLDQIPLRFSVSEPEGHLHVPLLVTPWSYAT